MFNAWSICSTIPLSSLSSSQSFCVHFHSLCSSSPYAFIFNLRLFLDLRLTKDSFWVRFMAGGDETDTNQKAQIGMFDRSYLPTSFACWNQVKEEPSCQVADANSRNRQTLNFVIVLLLFCWFCVFGDVLQMLQKQTPKSVKFSHEMFFETFKTNGFSIYLKNWSWFIPHHLPQLASNIWQENF